MIEKEYPYKRLDGTLDNARIRFYSSDGKKIINIKTGEIYDEAVDPYPTNNVYEEVEPVIAVLDDGITEESSELPEGTEIV